MEESSMPGSIASIFVHLDFQRYTPFVSSPIILLSTLFNPVFVSYLFSIAFSKNFPNSSILLEAHSKELSYVHHRYTSVAKFLK